MSRMDVTENFVPGFFDTMHQHDICIHLCRSCSNALKFVLCKRNFRHQKTWCALCRMLAKARASVIHSKLVPLIHKRCASGSVMILEDNAIAKHGKICQTSQSAPVRRHLRCATGVFDPPRAAEKWKDWIH